MAFVSAVVGFVKLWQGDTGLVTVVLIVVGVVGAWLGCAYLAFERTYPLVEGGKGFPKYPRLRRWALAGLVIIPLLTGLGSAILVNYQHQHAIWDMEPFPEARLGVLVSDFGEGPNFKESPKGKDVSEALYRSLSEQTRLTGLSQAVVRQLKVTIHNEEEAKALGNELGATLVIWGRIGSDQQALFPCFTLLKVLEMVSSLEPTDLSPYYTPLSSSQTVQLGEALSSRVAVLTAFTIGLIRMSDRDYERAVREFSKAIEMAEQSPGADILYDYRGRAYIGQWKLEPALEDFQYALALNPNNPSLCVGIGSIYYHKHEWERAAEMYRQALSIHPDYPRAYMGLAAVNTIQGDYEEAIRYGELAVASKEDYALAYYSLGANHYRLGNKEEAIAAFENCLKFVGANKGLKSASEQNLALAKQLPVVSVISTPPATQVAIPTPTPIPTFTLAPTPTQATTATSTSIHLVTVSTNTASTSALTSVPTSTPTSTPTAMPTPTSYSPPQLIEPPDGMTIMGGLTRFAWTWEGTLGPDEYFDLKIRPLGDPNSVFVDWSKEPVYILDARIVPLLEENKTYIWTIQILRGHYDGEKKILETFLSPESGGFVMHRGVIHSEPDDPGASQPTD